VRIIERARGWLDEPHGQNTGGGELEPLGPHKVGGLWLSVGWGLRHSDLVTLQQQPWTWSQVYS